MSPVSANQESLKAKQLAADAENKTRVGKGTRVKVGQTRGKNPSVISWDYFDTDSKDTLPESIKEFADVTGIKKESELVAYLIDGFNGAQYSAASDEIGEYLDDSWDKETAAQFRLVIRNMSRMTGASIEDTVKMLKPGIQAAFESKAKAEAPAAAE